MSPDLYFDVDHIGNGMLRLDSEYFPCEDDHVLLHEDGHLTASIPLENGAALVLFIGDTHASVWLWDGHWCKIERGRIVAASPLTACDDWHEVVRSTDDIKAYMRQLGSMEASRAQIDEPGELQVGQLDDQGDDSPLAELLA